jgi:tRNA (uracil-5-)-methyltransferase TRM9
MDPAKLEADHVRQVYDDIAQHFSNTRYKAWPVVDSFVKSLQTGSVGIDIGCGNGKNMLIRTVDIFCTGFDLSIELLKICQKHGFDTIQGNMLHLPYRTASQDFVICIAALHHLASTERRLQATTEIGRILKANGVALLYVWALEQPENSSLHRHKLESLSKDQQDVLVPWTSGSTTQMRFYHLFRKGELEELIQESGVFKVTNSGYDRDNWYVCIRRLS